MKGCVAAVAIALLALAGCGSDGSSSVKEPPPDPNIEAALIGTVRMPDGEFASANPLLRYLADFQLIPKAFAVNGSGLPPGFLPVGPEHLVTVSRVNAEDVAHGNTAGAILLGGDFTDADGFYEIVDADVREVEQKCRLLASVGGGPDTTRSFVWQHTVDVDMVSETVVRLILQRLTMAPVVQLCDFFTADAMQCIAREVERATPAATGTTVAEYNDSAFSRAAASGCVRKAIAAATGGEYEDGRGPIVCARAICQD